MGLQPFIYLITILTFVLLDAIPMVGQEPIKQKPQTLGYTPRAAITPSLFPQEKSLCRKPLDTLHGVAVSSDKRLRDYRFHLPALDKTKENILREKFLIAGTYPSQKNNQDSSEIPLPDDVLNLFIDLLKDQRISQLSSHAQETDKPGHNVTNKETFEVISSPSTTFNFLKLTRSPIQKKWDGHSVRSWRIPIIGRTKDGRKINVILGLDYEGLGLVIISRYDPTIRY